MGNYIDPGDVNNWPSGTTAEEQAAKILEIEQLLEKTLGTHFYSKAFDHKVNGNNKNRLFLGLEAAILTVTKIFINGIELDAGWWTWDQASVFVDLTTSGSGIFDPELAYMRSRSQQQGIFPKGFENIRIKGTYGYAVVPEPIKRLCIILVQHDNDPDLYTSYLYDSEKIGDYSYKIGAASTKAIPVIFGLWEADRIAARYRRQKKTKILTY